MKIDSKFDLVMSCMLLWVSVLYMTVNLWTNQASIIFTTQTWWGTVLMCLATFGWLGWAYTINKLITQEYNRNVW